MMTDWYKKSMNAHALNGKADRTQEAYTRALRMLCEYYDNVSEEISEAELGAYFLHRRNIDHCSPNTMRICYCGIRFYFVQILLRHCKQPAPAHDGAATNRIHAAFFAAYLACRIYEGAPLRFFVAEFFDVD